MARVLIADDDDLLAALLQVKLESAQFQVSVAHDGPQALALAREQRPDVIVLDAMMPGCDGFTVARKLREAAATRGIPILMLTARRSKSDVERAIGAGVRDYMIKPFRIEQLIKRIVHLIDERLAPATSA